MFFTRILNIRFLAVLALAFVAAIAAYGHAASNTVTSKAAGDGSAPISGYTQSATSYTFNSTDPGKIDAVKFDLASDTAPKPTTVKIKLVSTGTDWYSCSAVDSLDTVSPWSFTCATTSTQATTASANELRVVAVE